MVLGYMFRQYCGYLQANLYRLSALNVRTICDPKKRILESKICYNLDSDRT